MAAARPLRPRTPRRSFEEDHANARLLADAFAANEGFELESGPVETNLVWVKVDPSLGTAAEVAAYLRSRNILVTVIGAQVLAPAPTSTSRAKRPNMPPA